jgi:hypothetical protein
MNATQSPRFWWLKRLTPLGVLVLAGAVGVHVWFAAHVAAQREATFAEWEADGGPHPGQLEMITGVPADRPDNPAVQLREALSIMPALTPEQATWERDLILEDWFEMNEADRVMTASIVADSAASFELVRDARSRPYASADWGTPAITMTGPFKNWNQERELATRLGYGAVVAALDGDMDAAIERVRDIDHLAASSVTHSPSLITGLLAIGVQALGADRAQRLPLVPAEDVAWRDAAPAVRGLIADLMDEERDLHVLQSAYSCSVGSSDLG